MIRLATASDLRRIFEVYAVARQLMRQSGNPRQWGDHFPPEELLRGDIPKKQLWVAGSLGAVAHSIGQVAAASALMGSVGVFVYLPALAAVSIVTGFCTGLSAQYLVNRGNIPWTISSK